VKQLQVLDKGSGVMTGVVFFVLVLDECVYNTGDSPRAALSIFLSFVEGPFFPSTLVILSSTAYRHPLGTDVGNTK